MGLTLNEIWPQFNRLIQSNVGTDIDRKINALNVAQSFLIERMYQLGKRIDEFLSDPTNLTNTIDTNYTPTPSDFLAINTAWYRSGAQYLPFGKDAIITYNDLLLRIGQNFFSTDSNGVPTLVAVKEPNIYYDQHFNNTFTDSETITGATSGATGTVDSVSSTTLTYTSVLGSFTDGEVILGSTSGTQATISAVVATTMTIAITGGTKEVKLSYIKYPSDMSYYNTINLTGITGTFTVGEEITGITSNATGTVTAVNTSSLSYTPTNGTFSDGEVIQGVSSSAMGTQDGAVVSLPYELDFSEKYKHVLTEAGSLIWEHMKGSNGVPARADVVDGLIEMLSLLNRGSEVTTWSTNNNGIQ